MSLAGDPDLVFFDGDCGLCTRSVRFLAARDPDGARFRFAPLGGATFRERLDDATRAALPDSLVVRTPAGDVLVRSTAVVRTLRRIGGGWGLLGRVFGWLPTGLRDLLYRGVARIRRRVVPPPHQCERPPEDWVRRLLP